MATLKLTPTATEVDLEIEGMRWVVLRPPTVCVVPVVPVVPVPALVWVRALLIDKVDCR